MRWFQTAVKLGILSTLAAAGALILAAWRIESASASCVESELKELPHRRVGLVLGCSPFVSSGKRNAFFENRMAAAVNVFQGGKVDYLLVSGDNRRANYNEPEAMKKTLVRLGVPENRIVADYAGFTTLDSILRAKEVFGLSEFCVISQRDHVQRAIYIARANGIDAVGFPAKDVSTFSGLRTRIRESLARVRALLDVHVLNRQPELLGPKIEIG